MVAVFVPDVCELYQAGSWGWWLAGCWMGYVGVQLGIGAIVVMSAAYLRRLTNVGGGSGAGYAQ